MKVFEAFVYNVPFNVNGKTTVFQIVGKNLELNRFKFESLNIKYNRMFVYPIIIVRFYCEADRLKFLYFLKNTGLNYFRPLTIPNLFPYLINKDYDLIVYNLPQSFGYINTDEVMFKMADAMGFESSRIRCSFPKWNPNYDNPGIVVKFYSKEDRDEFFKILRSNFVWCDSSSEGVFEVQAQPYLGGEPLEIYRCARAYVQAGLLATTMIFDGTVYVMHHFDGLGIPVQTFDQLSVAMFNSQCRSIGDY